MKFGEHLRKARKQIGWTQKRLAEEAGYSQAYLCDVEKDRRPSPGNLVVDLARVLDESESLLSVWAGTLPRYLRDLDSDQAELLSQTLDEFARHSGLMPKKERRP